jgi:hypothetical protein
VLGVEPLPPDEVLWDAILESASLNEVDLPKVLLVLLVLIDLVDLVEHDHRGLLLSLLAHAGRRLAHRLKHCCSHTRRECYSRD